MSKFAWFSWCSKKKDLNFINWLYDSQIIHLNESLLSSLNLSFKSSWKIVIKLDINIPLFYQLPVALLSSTFFSSCPLVHHPFVQLYLLQNVFDQLFLFPCHYPVVFIVVTLLSCFYAFILLSNSPFVISHLLLSSSLYPIVFSVVPYCLGSLIVVLLFLSCCLCPIIIILLSLSLSIYL